MYVVRVRKLGCMWWGQGSWNGLGEEVVKLEWMRGEEARMNVVRVGKLERMRLRKLGCMW